MIWNVFRYAHSGAPALCLFALYGVISLVRQQVLMISQTPIQGNIEHVRTM